MELGQRLRQARLEAGFSQRQLCGDVITRNMLSQIEHGAAQPSMDTLRYLAGRLGKTVGYFLDEDVVTSPNQAVMERARAAYDGGNMQQALEVLGDYSEPDAIFDREKWLMEALACMVLAEDSLEQERQRYALELLRRADEAGRKNGYFSLELERRRLLLLAKAKGQTPGSICMQLPGLDEELLLRAEAALEAGDTARSAALLEAAEDRMSVRWNLLRGRVHMTCGEYTRAVSCLQRVEDTCPEALPLLEYCCRELEDYKQAYFYACKQKEK